MTAQEPALYGKSFPKVTREVWLMKNKYVVCVWDDFIVVAHKASGLTLMKMTIDEWLMVSMLQSTSAVTGLKREPFMAFYKSPKRKAEK